MMSYPYKRHSKEKEVRFRSIGATTFALLLLLGFYQPMAIAAPIEQDLSEIEKAKSDVLLLDRELSRLEHAIIYPNRTLILFGLSPKSKATVNQLDVSIDGRALPVKYFSRLELDSLKMGGMVSVFDDNFTAGSHVIEVKMQDAATQQQYSQSLSVQKTKAKNIVGIRFVERPAPHTSPIRLVEWPLDD